MERLKLFLSLFANINKTHASDGKNYTIPVFICIYPPNKKHTQEMEIIKLFLFLFANKNQKHTRDGKI